MIHALALAASAAEPPPAIAVSAGVALLGTDDRPYAGELESLSDGLGSHLKQSDSLHVVPVLSESLSLPYAEGRVWLGVELTERWWRVWAESRNDVVASASHRIDRSVIAVDALATASLRVRTSASIFVGLGPALYWIGTRQRGWFGDDRGVDYALGARALVGCRIHISNSFAFVPDISYETFRMPSRNVVLKDGGPAPALSLGFRIQVTL